MYIKVKKWNYPTLCSPMDCSPPGFSVHEISQARILEWVSIPLFRGSSQSRDWTLGLPCCRQILYCLSYQGSPYTVQRWTWFGGLIIFGKELTFMQLSGSLYWAWLNILASVYVLQVKNCVFWRKQLPSELRAGIVSAELVLNSLLVQLQRLVWADLHAMENVSAVILSVTHGRGLKTGVSEETVKRKD